MCSIVDRVKNMVVYIDHEDIIASGNWDDVVANPKAELPKVIIPIKVIHVERKEAEELPEFYKNLGKGIDLQSQDKGSNDTDSEVDDEFVDSDNDLDDDLFADTGVHEVLTRTKKAKGSRLRGDRPSSSIQVDEDATTDEDFMDLSDKEDGGKNMMFTNFREDDTSFRIGMVFDSIETVRKVVTEYSLRNRVDIKLPRNDQRRVRAHCAEGCPWGFYASYDSRAKAFVVKTYTET
jgi:hypothetical protein